MQCVHVFTCVHAAPGVDDESQQQAVAEAAAKAQAEQDLVERFWANLRQEVASCSHTDNLRDMAWLQLMCAVNIEKLPDKDRVLIQTCYFVVFYLWVRHTYD